MANLADVGRVFVFRVSHSAGAVRSLQIVLLAFLFVGMVVIAGGISVIITGTNLSGVTGIVIGDTAPTAHMPQGKSSAHSRGLVAKKTQATAKRRRLPFLR